MDAEILRINHHSHCAISYPISSIKSLNSKTSTLQILLELSAWVGECTLNVFLCVLDHLQTYSFGCCNDVLKYHLPLSTQVLLSKWSFLVLIQVHILLHKDSREKKCLKAILPSKLLNPSFFGGGGVVLPILKRLSTIWPAILITIGILGFYILHYGFFIFHINI